MGGIKYRIEYMQISFPTVRKHKYKKKKKSQKAEGENDEEK